MEEIKKGFEKIEPRHVKTGGYVLLSVGILVLIILQFVGMGYASKIAFSKGTPLPDGRVCYNISKTDVNLIRMASIFLWIGIPLQIYKLYGQVCNNKPLSCAWRLAAMGAAILFAAEFFGLIILTRFAFALKKENGGYCAKISGIEQSLLGTAMIVVWIVLILFGLDISTTLFESFKKPKKVSSRSSMGYGYRYGFGRF